MSGVSCLPPSLDPLYLRGIQTQCRKFRSVEKLQSAGYKKKKKKKKKNKEDAHKNVEERRIDYGLFLTF